MVELKFLKFVGFFLKNSYEEVYLRELARKLKISSFAAKKYADILVDEGLLTEERKANLRYFRPNLSNLFYRYLKVAYNLRLILKCGLIEFLKDNIPNLTSIVLFGSISKGEDDPKSDLDLIIIGKEKKLDLSKFESKINREINIHFYNWSVWNKKAREDSPFYYEVINSGTPLFGILPLVKDGNKKY